MDVDVINLKYTTKSGDTMSEEMSELEQMRMIAADRLVWLRLLEKSVNDIDGILRGLKADVAEISQQVANRNAEMTAFPVEDDEADADDDAE